MCLLIESRFGEYEYHSYTLLQSFCVCIFLLQWEEWGITFCNCLFITLQSCCIYVHIFTQPFDEVLNLDSYEYQFFTLHWCHRGTVLKFEISVAVSMQWTGLFCRRLTDLEYEEICEETLNSITEKFEELADSDAIGTDFDVSFSVGLATLYHN